MSSGGIFCRHRFCGYRWLSPPVVNEQAGGHYWPRLLFRFPAKRRYPDRLRMLLRRMLYPVLFTLTSFKSTMNGRSLLGEILRRRLLLHFDFTLVETELPRVFDACLGIEHGLGTILENQLHTFTFGDIYLFVAGIGKQVDTFIYIPELTEE